ncbi:MAG: glycosyltransferase, partial [Myxococcota bacterium]
ALGREFSGDARVRYDGKALRAGIAGTRNLALTRVRGDAVLTLDHDDVLLPDGCATLTRALSRSGTRWAIAQVGELGGDGSMTGVSPDLSPGVIPPGAVHRLFEQNDSFPFYCSAGAIVRTNVLRACGGWAGVPHSEDVAVFAAIAEQWPGFYEPVRVALHRVWPEQTSQHAWWKALKPEARATVHQRVAAIREVRLSDGRREQP